MKFLETINKKWKVRAHEKKYVYTNDDFFSSTKENIYATYCIKNRPGVSEYSASFERERPARPIREQSDCSLRR